MAKAMRKSKRKEEPADGAGPEFDLAPKTAAEAAAGPAGDDSPGSPGDSPVEVDLRVPLTEGVAAGSYVPIHVEARLKPWHGEILKRLAEALMSRAARLVERRRVDGQTVETEGRFVQSGADAVRWILEEIQRRLGRPGGPGE